LRYHTTQTRPINKTDEAIAALLAAIAVAESEPQAAVPTRWIRTYRHYLEWENSAKEDTVGSMREEVSYSAKRPDYGEGWMPLYITATAPAIPLRGTTEMPHFASVGMPAPTIPTPCQDAVTMGKHACTNRNQCWEPCGELGHSAEHAKRAPDTPKEPAANRQIVDDLSALVSRLVRALNKSAPTHDLPEKAMDYLRRKNLLGSPLRSELRDKEAETKAIHELFAQPISLPAAKGAERDAFEVWAIEYGFSLGKCSLEEMNQRTHAWEGWQARAALYDRPQPAKEE
jgi:hypothetical protein